jgi:hypothetical protein
MRVPLVTVALCLAPALVLPQSLGDAARLQAKRRTERAPAVAKAFTDDDLRAEAGATATADAEGTSSARAEPGPPDGAAGAAVVAPERAPAPDEAVRAQLDREADQRKQRELLWRQRAGQALARLDAAHREHDVVCGPGVLALTGG